RLFAARILKSEGLVIQLHELDFLDLADKAGIIRCLAGQDQRRRQGVPAKLPCARENVVPRRVAPSLEVAICRKDQVADAVTASPGSGQFLLQGRNSCGLFDLPSHAESEQQQDGG